MTASELSSAKFGEKKFPLPEHKKAHTAIKTVRALPLPLAHDLAVHLPFLFLKPLDQDDHSVAHHEVGLLVLVGVAAHADGSIGKVAEHAAAVLSGDSGVPAAAYRVALFRSISPVSLFRAVMWRGSTPMMVPVRALRPR